MREEFLNICIHDDEQLENLLNKKIILREKLHQWPLSYVEKVTLKDNTNFVYKSQNSASSVEREFYSKIKNPYLLSPMFSEKYENCDIMILPYLDYPMLGELSEIKLEQTVMNISRIIQDFSNMPVFFDLSSVEKLMQIINTVCVIFDEKGETKNINALKNWISEKAHVCYDNQQIGNVHGDLNVTNILIENGELRCILDWQRPMIAPVMLESALAFRLAGYDAVKKYGNFGILSVICYFIWYSYACMKFMPFVFNHAHKFLLEFISLGE